MRALLSSFHDIAQQFITMREERIRPVSICYIGKSAVGKSSSMQILQREVVQQIRPRLPFNAATDRYRKAERDDYYSGYGNPVVVELDDIFQQLDPEVTSQRVREIIDMHNISPMSLNMPGLQEKGVTYFEAKLLCFTSNADFLWDRTPGIDSSRIFSVIRGGHQSYDAIRNRFDYYCLVEVLPKYRNPDGTVNEEKVAADNLTGSPRINVYRFPRHHLPGLRFKSTIRKAKIAALGLSEDEFVQERDRVGNEPPSYYLDYTYDEIIADVVELYRHRELQYYAKQKDFLASQNNLPQFSRRQLGSHLLDFHPDIGIFKHHCQLYFDDFLLEKPADIDVDTYLERAWEYLSDQMADAEDSSTTATWAVRDFLRNGFSSLFKNAFNLYSTIAVKISAYSSAFTEWIEPVTKSLRDAWSNRLSLNDMILQLKMVPPSAWAGILSALAIVPLAGAHLYNRYQQLTNPPQFPHLSYNSTFPNEGDFQKSHRKATRRAPRRQTGFGSRSHARSGGLAYASAPSIENKFVNNRIFLKLQVNDRTFPFQGVWLDGTTVMCNAHSVLKAIRPASRTSSRYAMKVTWQGRTVELDHDWVEELLDHCVYNTALDYLLFDAYEWFPRDCATAPSILKYFMSAAEKARFVSSLKGRAAQHVNFNTVQHDENGMLTLQLSGSNPRYEQRLVVGTTRFDDLIVYSHPSKPGYCGALVSHDALGFPPLVGIHAAGNDDSTGTTFLWQEELVEAIAQLRESTPSENELQVHSLPLEDKSIYAWIQAEFPDVKVEKIAPEYRIRINDKSKLIPSPVHGVFPVIHAPARMRACQYPDGRPPMKVGLAKQFTKDVVFPPSVFNRAFDSLLDYYRSKFGLTEPPEHLPAYLCPERDPPVWPKMPLHTIVNGSLTDEHQKPLNMATSAGFPFNCPAIYPQMQKGKRSLFYRSDDTWQVSDEVINMFEQAVYWCENGDIEALEKSHWLDFEDTMKDEKLARDKVCRVFSAGGLIGTLLGKYYYGNFMSLLMHKCTDWEIVVGVNPTDSRQWNRLAERLIKFDEGRGWYFAGDYSNFDKGLPSQVIKAAFDIMDNIISEQQQRLDEHPYRRDYTDENTEFDEAGLVGRSTYARFIYNAIHRCGDARYHVTHGNPSGNALTTIINSLCNQLLLRIGFYAMKPQGTFAEFNEEVDCFVFGDDNVVVSRVPWFNLRALSDTLGSFGLKYTDPTKQSGKELSEFLPWHEISLLKRRWKPTVAQHPSGQMKMRFWAPLDYVSVFDSINWVKKSPDMMETFKECLRQSQYEAFLHSPTQFRAVTQRLADAMKSAHLPWNPMSLDIARWYADEGTDDQWSNYIPLDLPEIAFGAWDSLELCVFDHIPHIDPDLADPENMIYDYQFETSNSELDDETDNQMPLRLW
uniref:RNA-directed RNA polymerase n=1 Tax=Red panda picorna-like virus TaxID=2864000 RepID=A0A8K1HHJ9_9VIRU|nr:hypothetical protein 1 [Red panda picorna-like virus]